MKRILLATLLPAALAACAPEAPTVGGHDQAIIGGGASPADHAVVLLASYPANRSVLATCTAALIAPTVLVTAAHCVDAPHHPGYLYGVFPGEDASVYPRLVDLEPHLLAVTAVHAHPAYNPAAPFHADIAVVILAQPLTGVTPLGLWRGPVTGLVGAPARIVGYGQQVVGTPASTRRQATTVVAGLDPDDTIAVGAPGHVTCIGDSGGPALVYHSGLEVIVGVDSYADDALCDQPAHFRLAAVYQGFLDGYTGDHPPEIDAGVTGPDAGASATDGGGCSAAGRSATSPLVVVLVLVLVLALGLGRRPRRRR